MNHLFYPFVIRKSWNVKRNRKYLTILLSEKYMVNDNILN